MLGEHVLKHWSSTQASVTLSSGEAEFNGVVRGSGQGLGSQALLKDLGTELPLRVWTDSTAAIGICSRQGLGKLRHLDTHTLWVQQAVRTGRIELKKILGTENPADLMTNHMCSGETLRQLVALFGCEYVGGRAESAPNLKRGDSDKVTMADTDIQNVESESNNNVDKQTARMPHLEMKRAELDAAFPISDAVEKDGLEDLEWPDPMLDHGMKLAKTVQQQMIKTGRTRREDPESVNNTDKESGCQSDESKRRTTTTHKRPCATIKQLIASQCSTDISGSDSSRPPGRT
jgi:hypothetical protein